MPNADKPSLLDPEKTEGMTILVHLGLQVFLTIASTVAFFVVLGFVLWKPNTYLVVVDVFLSPSFFLVMRYFFTRPATKKKKATTTPKK